MKNKLICFVIIFSFVVSRDISNMELVHQKSLDHFQTYLIYNEIQNLSQIQAQQQPLRITFDTTLLNSSEISKTKLYYLENILEISKNFMKEFIKIVPTQGNNIINVSKKCQQEGKVKISEQDQSISIKDSDLHIFIAHIKNSESVAMSGICSLSQNNGILRPNSGIIFINLYKIPEQNSNFGFAPYLDLMINQMMILLGFGGSKLARDMDQILGNNYATKKWKKVIEIETINNISRAIVKSPNILATARKFYGCHNLKGMILEKKDNPEDIGSYWDFSILPTEIMNNIIELDKKRISVMTIALLKDTGFLADVNENFSNNYYWGKEKGCDFLNKETKKSSYYFQLYKNKGCDFWNDHSNIQLNDKSANLEMQYCYHPDAGFRWQNESFDDFGQNSKCFVSNLQIPNSLNSQRFGNSRCHFFECSEDEKQITIHFSKLPDFQVSCNQNNIGKTIPVDYQGKLIGTLTCPSNYNQFCEKTSCLNDCSKNGFCIRGNCHCKTGFSGIDCSIQCSKYSLNRICISDCPDNTFANPDNTCKINCPKGYYKELDQRKCLPCDFSCSKCNGPLHTECTACQFLTYLDGSICVRTCPAGKYADESTKSCVSP